jgi:hypothetical protein
MNPKTNKEYWIYNDSIIFKPNFDKDLDEYYHIINKYKKLYFSDYDNYMTTIKSNNDKFDFYDYNIIKNSNSFRQKKLYVTNNNKSKFNKKIDLSKLNNITHIYFGDLFDQNIYFPENNNIECLSFGLYFRYTKNFTLENCKKLKKIYFDMSFSFDSVKENQNEKECENKIIKFENCVNLEILIYNYIIINESLDFSRCEKLHSLVLDSSTYRKPILFPPNLKYFRPGSMWLNELDNYLPNGYNLPHGLEIIEIGRNHLGGKIDFLSLPNTIKKIYFFHHLIKSYEYDMDNLPDSIELLQLDYYYMEKITKIPKNLKKIIGHKEDNNIKYIKNLKNNIKIEYYL